MSEKINLVFEGQKKLTKLQIQKCQEIINNIHFEESTRGSVIAKKVNLTPPQFRSYITLIRENNREFFNSYFIVADAKGYKITGRKREIKKFHKKLEKLTHSKVRQLYQLGEVQ